ncbi:MAG TPA: hypothetical protein VFG42_04975 [Baekduia sp.]|uniref:hypothetical protein n=1 Tax=Baekduia sp. TaxID=2600305 RepID=UPI002D783836|nr:hypothetical protein [Baekduia sp.]HET6506118.1 hypothetical protein [Baekduia sp.]
MTARPIAALAALTLALAVGLGATAAADADADADAAGWHSEQPVAAGGTVPTAIGTVYDLAFWAPNRGMLITADGLWAFDGARWYRYSTVCGGTDGRIAWAGPSDFWTISDQPVGQPNPTNESRAGRSLCHFVNGAVVASYAQPMGQAGSYLPMRGAACLAPNDCWFGGARLPGTTNAGAFHLHWDGASLTPWPSLVAHDPSVSDPDRAVSDIAAFQGALYESVTVDDNPVADEPNDHPFLLHAIQAGTPPAFTPLFASPQVDYGTARPSDVEGLMLSSDGATLWGVAGGKDPTVRGAGPVVVRFQGGEPTALTLTDPDRTLAPGGFVTSAAAEPGTDSAWVAYTPPGEGGGSLSRLARLVRVHGDGTVDDATALPSADDDIARKGAADQVACAAAGQCWMATNSGWLFHLGGPLPRDDDPGLHRLITYRPSDGATPIVSPDTLPDDDSGIAPPVFSQPPPVGYTPPKQSSTKAKAKKLVTGVTRKMVSRTTLRLTFTLTAKARVQLLAKRGSKVVARSKRRTLAKGRHRIELTLDRRRWPTQLDLRAEPYQKPKGAA